MLGPWKIYKDDMIKTTTNKYGEGKNTTDEYKDDKMAITMNGHGELDRTYEEQIWNVLFI
jgi:hypothetical protein